MSTVLDNYYDPNYDPNDQEVKDYGAWLGLDLPEEDELLWIAREGLKAALPENWKACKSEKGELYYFNFKSGQSIWDHPSDDKFKAQAANEQERRKDFLAKGERYQRPALSSSRSRSASPQAQKTPESSASTNEKETAAVVKKESKTKKESKSKRKASDSPATEDPTDVAAPTTTTEEGAKEEGSTASKGKGSKLAQLKSLKSGTKLQRASAITMVETPVSNASPHAKKEKELAPLLKPNSSLTVTAAPTKDLPPVNDSPQPKNPNNGAVTTSILSKSPMVLQVAKPESATVVAVPATNAQPAVLTGSTRNTDPQVSPIHQDLAPGGPGNTQQQQKQAVAAANEALLQRTKEDAEKATDSAIAAFQSKEKQRLDDEKVQAVAHYDALFKKAKEQLAQRHKGNLDGITKEFGDKLTACKQQLQSRQKDEIEKLHNSLKKQTSEEKKRLEENNEDEIAALRRKLGSQLNKDLDAMNADHKQTLEAERAAIEAKTKQEIVKLHEMPQEDKEEWASVGDTMNELVGTFFQDVEVSLTQLTTASTSLTLEELRGKAAEKIKAAELETQAMIEKEKSSGSEAVEKYRAEFTKKFQAERDMSDERVEHLVSSNKAELSRLVEQHEQTFAEMKTSHRAAKDKLESANNEEMDFLRSAHAQRLQELGAEMQAAFEERKSVLAAHYETEEHRALDRVDLGIPQADAPLARNRTAEGLGTADDSADDAAAEMLKSFPSPSPGTTTASSANHLQHGGVTSGESSGEKAAKRDHVEGSEKLRAAVYDVLQDVLQAHPMLRHLQQLNAAENNGGRSSTPPRMPASTAAAGIVTPIRHGGAHHAAAAQGGTSYPTSFVEQQHLLEQEAMRVEEAKHFVGMQRSTLNEQRLKLKAARRQWKKDVILAKAQGATAGSKQAALLRKIQRVLDQQAEGLEQDENILKDSEHWLKVKEGRVQQLTTDLEVRGDCDLSALSVDTQQLMGPLLMTPGKKAMPQYTAVQSQPHLSRSASAAEHRSSSTHNKRRGQSPGAPEDALHRIERRLDAMAGVIASQQDHHERSHKPSSSSALVRTERSNSASGVLVNSTNLLQPNPQQVVKSSNNRSSRKRSTSASRRVAFMASNAAYTGSGAASAWVGGN